MASIISNDDEKPIDKLIHSDVDSITQQLGDIEIGTKSSGFLRQGSSESKNLGSAMASSCLSHSGYPRKIPRDEVVYIIAAHGIFNNSIKFKGVPYPTGHNITIEGAEDKWRNLNFGVLVSEGTLLLTKPNESRQTAVQRHVHDIVSGGINVYQRFPWKERGPHSSTAIFPNLIFGEGGGEEDPFVSTIVRYYNGNITFFQLSRSVSANKLIRFNRAGTYPKKSQLDPQNLGKESFVLLSQLLTLISNDIKSARVKSARIKKTNIIFATCMENVPQSIHDTWIGREPNKPPVMGGKRKKKKKSNRQKSIKKKRNIKLKTRLRKRSQKKKRKRKTHKRKKRTFKKRTFKKSSQKLKN